VNPQKEILLMVILLMVILLMVILQKEIR